MSGIGDHMAKKKTEISRRDMLKILGSVPAAVPLSSFAQLLVGGMTRSAQASTTTGKKYVYFTQPGSPPRWMFDLFLVPYGKTGFVANGGLGTVGVETAGKYTGIKYETIVRKGLNVPPIWGVMVPDGAGGVRPLDNLLDNLLSIRGIDVPSPGHPLAQTLSFRPTGAEYTVTGLTAEAGTGFPIKAINMTCPGYEFACRKPMTPTKMGLNGANTGTALLSPFMSSASTTFLSRRDQLKASIDAAMAALKEYALSQHPGSIVIEGAQADAAQVMGDRAKELLAKWNVIYPKYVAIMKESLQNVVIPGLTDKPYGATRPTNSAELASMYKFYQTININTPVDLRDMFTANTVVNGLAESFTVAELALTENLCNSVCTPIGSVSGLAINGGSMSHVLDEHFTAAFSALIINTKMYLAIGACMLEFIQVLKNANMFNDVVIQFGGEFNRSPENDGSSSNHGYQGGSTSIFSGMVSGTTVVGNILNNAPHPSAIGTWGWAAPSIGGRKIDVADVANCLAKMLGLPQILRRNDEIISIQGGYVVSQIANSTQV